MIVKTSEDVQRYLQGTEYPASPEDLMSAAQDNGAPPDFSELLGLLPTVVEFHAPGEVAEHIEHTKGLG
jgi:hypothetical protein